MKHDVVLCFITPAGTRLTGFITPEPMASTRQEAIGVRDQVQAKISDLTTLSIYTRDTTLILQGSNPTPMELTLPGELIKQSAMLSQIIERDE